MYGQGQRKPIPRHKPLKQGSSQMKRSPLKPRSDKAKDTYRKERVPFVEKVLGERPLCEACPTCPAGRKNSPRNSTDVHEILTRGRSGGVKGKAWLDEDNVLALCRTCHTWITAHPKESLDLGFVRKWNKELDDPDNP